MANASLAAIHKFFGTATMPGSPEYKLSKFRADWAALTEADKAQIKAGIENDTYNY